MERPVLVSGTDGVGTKLKMAFLMDKHDTVGIDCVAMCVNDIICCGAKPLFFLDYIACGKNVPERIEAIVKGVAEGCVQSGCALIGGETAEMPGFYPIDEYDLAGYSTGVVDRSKILDKTTVTEGDVIVALPSSGVHSNGFSLVRKVFDVENADIKSPVAELGGKSIGETLLTPTKIYVKPMLALFEQVKVNLGYMQHNVKLVGIASGLGVSHQGNTHFGLDDVSLMRAIPNMTIVVPSDCTEVAKATIALAEMEGPAYLRLVGEGFVPIVNDDDYEFKIGKGIKKHEGNDVLIIANGTMVNQSLKVAKELSEQSGIETTVINMHTVKPLDTQIIDDNISGKKLIVTMEEGQINGGLGSAIAEYMASIGNTPKMLRLGVKDIFPHAGSYQYLLEQCGIDVESIKKMIINTIK